MSAFKGFPADGPEFYAELEANNTKEWWTAHKEIYEQAVREPMDALLDELSAEFGEAKAFRPYRDVRFSKDKAPYKTHQGGFAETVPGAGYYLHIDADGLTLGGGYHSHTPVQIARFRAAVDAPASGGELETILQTLRGEGYEINGERLKTVPREYAKDHPRGELLKYKSLTAGKAFGTPEWLGSPEALERVRAGWTDLRPLVEWLTEHLSG